MKNLYQKAAIWITMQKRCPRRSDHSPTHFRNPKIRWENTRNFSTEIVNTEDFCDPKLFITLNIFAPPGALSKSAVQSRSWFLECPEVNRFLVRFVIFQISDIFFWSRATDSGREIFFFRREDGGIDQVVYSIFFCSRLKSTSCGRG